jgi:hypothetical protein
MKKTTYRRDAESTDHFRSRVGRMFALLGACILAWTAGYSTPASAGALKQAWIKDFQIIDTATGRVLPPKVHLKYKQKASARCKFEFVTESGPPAQVTPFSVMIYVNEFKQITRMSNVWDPHIKTDGAVGYGYATVPVNTTGTNGHYRTFGLNSMICIVGGKRKMVHYYVDPPAQKKPPLSFNRRGLSKRMSPKHGLAKLPNAHVRQCPTSVKAISKIDPHAFSAPFATASKATKIPDGHLMLYLDKVEAINDSLFCTYATRAGNAKSTVEIVCKGAHLQDKASHAYYCQ